MSISSLEPTLVSDAELLNEARRVFTLGGKLGRHLHANTLRAVAELLYTVNCYYSNLIEGHDTHPISIERAMNASYERDPIKRDLQIEAIAHIEVQKLIEHESLTYPGRNICDKEFLCWIHKEFYKRMPAALRRVRNPETGQVRSVVPGSLRSFPVRVGIHIPPDSDELPALLNRCAEVYNPALHTGSEGLLAAAAAHHRILWVHPFADGNGRVVRLLTDAYLARIGMESHGLWSVSRGLARRRDEYRSALQEADEPRRNNYDGRGNLSRRALVEFCRFFLAVCDDQISYMGGLLQVDALADRMAAYCKGREVGAIPDSNGKTDVSMTFRPEAALLLRQLIFRGSLERAEIGTVTNLKERTSRRLVSQLAEEGFILSDSHRAPIRLRFPAHAGTYLFPQLYAPQI
jgi:Fic family protein